MAATEWWQRGPVPEVPSLLQPVAHIVLQIGESVHELVADLTESQWNARPANVASIAFHVRHIAGVLDRLFTYARGSALTEIPAALAHLSAQIEASMHALRRTDPATLGDYRAVGRAQLPSTVIGCLVHGAEHGMRHVGQLSVTVRMVRSLAE
jgi:hypothetical protein